MLRQRNTSGVVTWRLFVRHVERLAAANLAAVVCCLLVLPAPAGLAGMLGVVEAVWRKPSRRPAAGDFIRGIRRYWRPMLVQWLLTLLVLGAVPVSLLFYGATLDGAYLWVMLAAETLFIVLLWILWIYAIGSAVADRAREEGRAAGEKVGLLEGVSHQVGEALTAWLIHVVMVFSVAGLFVAGLAVPALYVLAASAGPGKAGLEE